MIPGSTRAYSGKDGYYHVSTRFCNYPSAMVFTLYQGLNSTGLRGYGALVDYIGL